MSERLDFEMLWPVPAGRFGWSARGNTPCVMEIVSWLTVGTIDAAWPGVSRSIAEYVQAVQDAMDDEPRQKLLVLVPALIGCAKAGDPPEIETGRQLLLAQRSLSVLVPLVLEAAGRPHEADAVRRSGGAFARVRAVLREAIECAATNPLVAAVMDCVQRLIACADDVRAAAPAQLALRTIELAVSVIHCNHAPARRLMLGDRPRMRLLEFLEETIITIIEDAIGPARLPPPFTDPWEILEAGERFKKAMAAGFPPAASGQPETGRSPMRSMGHGGG
jgi:hypothetical protein